MIRAMTYERLRFVRRVTGKGRGYYRFRTPETGDCKLPGTPGDEAFHARYRELLEARRKIRAGLTGARDEDSFAGLIDRYLKSVEYRGLAPDTRLDYARTCKLLEGALVDPDTKASLPFRYVTRPILKAVRNRFAATTRKANKLTQMLSRLYSWAQEEELVPDGFNPASGIKRLKRPGGEKEIVAWSDAEIAWILAAAPAHVVTPILLALYTGQRREDVVSMTWQQWQGDELRVRTSKTRTLIDLGCHAVLKAHLEALRRESKIVSLTGPICLTPAGKPFTPNGLSGAVRRVVEKHAHVPDNRSMHGLRYAAAARMEEGGATVADIEAVLGHRTFKMALKYATGRKRGLAGVEAMKGEA